MKNKGDNKNKKQYLAWIVLISFNLLFSKEHFTKFTDHAIIKAIYLTNLLKFVS